MLTRFLNKDLDRNFFKEFAEKINFSGIPLKAVVSEEEYRKLFPARHKSDAGLIKKGIVISLKKRDLPSNPEAGDVVSVNGIEYRVISTNYPAEVLKLVLENIGE